MTDLEENELICGNLLGWARVPFEDAGGARWRCGADSPIATRPTPAFTTWADAGLIIQSMSKHGFALISLAIGASNFTHAQFTINDGTGPEASDLTPPLAIRAAALVYLASIA